VPATKEVLRNQTSKRAFKKLQNECAEEYGLILDKRYTFGRPRSWQKSPAQAPGSASADKELWKGIFVDSDLQEAVTARQAESGLIIAAANTSPIQEVLISRQEAVTARKAESGLAAANTSPIQEILISRQEAAVMARQEESGLAAANTSPIQISEVLMSSTPGKIASAEKQFNATFDAPSRRATDRGRPHRPKN
jgi:hypothetical protein